MGNYFSVAASCDVLAFEIAEKVREILARLEIQKVKLKSTRDDIVRKSGDKFLELNSVNEWIGLLNTKLDEVEVFLKKKEAQLNKIGCGCCVQFWCCCAYKFGPDMEIILGEVNTMLDHNAFYKFGLDVERLLGEVNTILDHNTFDLSNACSPALIQVEMTLNPLLYWSSWENVCGWEKITMEKEIIVGLLGMRGVGKTSILRKIMNESLGFFRHVIWIDAKDLGAVRIQTAIARNIGIVNELTWYSKNSSDKSNLIYNYLKSTRFALLIDNLSTKVDLNKLGVPYPNEINMSRFVFTTSKEEVYAEMQATLKLRVGSLGSDDAWKLFNLNARVEDDSEFVSVAKEIASLCRGVPRTLTTVGRLMSGKCRLQDWQHYLEVLMECRSRIDGTQNEPLDDVDESKFFAKAIMEYRDSFDSNLVDTSSSYMLKGITYMKEEFTRFGDKFDKFEQNLDIIDSQLNTYLDMSNRYISSCKKSIESLALKVAVLESRTNFDKSKNESASSKNIT